MEFVGRAYTPLLLATMRGAFPWLLPHLCRRLLCWREAAPGTCQAGPMDRRHRQAIRCYCKGLRTVYEGEPSGNR
jgi:hypothetical protein